MKILHTADWHLDSPFQGRTPQQTRQLRTQLLQIPQRIAQVCKNEKCDMVLLAGDVFDGAFSLDSYQAVYQALEDMEVPVFVAPGNHDFVSLESAWRTKKWPSNVHIFMNNTIESVVCGDCRVYGAGYQSMDCDALLEGFCAENDTAYRVGVLHADPVQAGSPYCPITKAQVKACGLSYLALGHIHKSDAFISGNTLCAWPGCPMGRGFDELGEKGVLIAQLDDTPSVRFVPIAGVRFQEIKVQVQDDALSSVLSVLPAVGNHDFYRVILTGPSEPIDMASLYAQLLQFPNLELRDQTTPPVDIWKSAGEDSFEGTYFQMLKDALAGADAQTARKIALAARISRQILDGQEVELP